jgi:hypothetical protein
MTIDKEEMLGECRELLDKLESIRDSVEVIIDKLDESDNVICTYDIDDAEAFLEDGMLADALLVIIGCLENPDDFEEDDDE